MKAAHRLLLVDVLRPERDQRVGLAHKLRLLQSPCLHNLHHQQAFVPVHAASGMRSRLGSGIEGGRLCAAADSSRVRAETPDMVRGVAVPRLLLQGCRALLTSPGWDSPQTAQAPAGAGLYCGQCAACAGRAGARDAAMAQARITRAGSCLCPVQQPGPSQDRPAWAVSVTACGHKRAGLVNTP